MTCARCQNMLKPGRSFCTACGFPTIASENYAAGLISNIDRSFPTQRRTKNVNKARTLLRGYILGTGLAILFVIFAIVGLVVIGSRASKSRQANRVNSDVSTPIKHSQETPAADEVSRTPTSSLSNSSVSEVPALTLSPLKFQEASAEDLGFLQGVVEAKSLLDGNFRIAHSDLCDNDGDDLVLMSGASAFCGSGGCETLAIQRHPVGYAVLLDENLPDELAVTGNQANGCRALVAIDENGKVLVGSTPDTPLFGKELIYPLHVK